MAKKNVKKLNTDLDLSLDSAKKEKSTQNPTEGKKANSKKNPVVSDESADTSNEEGAKAPVHDDGGDTEDYFTMGDIVYEDGNTDAEERKILSNLPTEGEEEIDADDPEADLGDLDFRDSILEDSLIDPDDDDQYY